VPNSSSTAVTSSVARRWLSDVIRSCSHGETGQPKTLLLLLCYGGDFVEQVIRDAIVVVNDPVGFGGCLWELLPALVADDAPSRSRMILLVKSAISCSWVMTTMVRPASLSVLSICMIS
jgi:hypothetical protein